MEMRSPPPPPPHFLLSCDAIVFLIKHTLSIHKSQMKPLALITGGGTGLGRAQALALAKKDVEVIIAGRRNEPLEKVQKEIQEIGGSCHILPGSDVGEIGTWKSFAGLIEEITGGELHMLCNTAGHEGILTDKGSYDKLEPEYIIKYNTMYIASLQLSYHFMAPLLARGAKNRNKPSVVINMSSVAGVCPRAFAHLFSLYHPYKAATEAITRCAHNMYQDQNILSYGLSPGVYESDMATSAGNQMEFDGAHGLAQAFNPITILGKAEHIGEITVTFFEGNMESSIMESGVHYAIVPMDESHSLLHNLSKFRSKMDSLNPILGEYHWMELEEAYTTKGTRATDDDLKKFHEAVKEKIRKEDVA